MVQLTLFLSVFNNELVGNNEQKEEKKPLYETRLVLCEHMQKKSFLDTTLVVVVVGRHECNFLVCLFWYYYVVHAKREKYNIRPSVHN